MNLEPVIQRISKKEKEKKCYWWIYLQGRNRCADVENGLVATAGEGEGGTNWESGIKIYILPCEKYIDSGKLL